LVVGFILEHVEEATWLSPIGIILKENGNLWIWVDFDKLNVATKKDLCFLPFIDEVLNIVTSHETYYFHDGFSKYHQISITSMGWYKIFLVNDWGAFVWSVMHFGVNYNGPLTS
jgi:hypothetical protein